MVCKNELRSHLAFVFCDSFACHFVESSLACSLSAMAGEDFSLEATREGYLPPWEIAKAYAFHEVISKLQQELGMQAAELLGMRADAYIASQVTLKGGGHPSARAIRALVNKCKDPEWFPGKPQSDVGGRPPVYTEHQKNEVARVAMDLKRKRVAPTPRRVRARLPQVARNPDTGRLMDKKTIQAIFKTRCFDENEDDPWQYLTCASQDALPEELKPLRVACAKHILAHVHPSAHTSHVAIDPCYSLLPKTQERLEAQEVAAMGKQRWMSPSSARSGHNLRAPSTTKTQTGGQVTRVDWTPVFARGRLHIYVCDADLAVRDSRYPAKLCDAQNLAKFVRNVLPGILETMKTKYGWSNIPRKVVHDKASYMVTAAHDRLNAAFAGALEEAGFTSWVGTDNHASTKWLVKRWGDVYLHETVIAHIRRLSEEDFACRRLYETPSQFRQRLQKVEDLMNSADFAAAGGRGLPGLAKELRSRCLQVIKLKGERIPK